MPKHRKFWLANVEAPPSAEELRASLSCKWVPDKVEGHESYVAKRTQTKDADKKRAGKVMRTEAVNAISRAFLRTETTQGQSPAVDDVD
jgi:hypothetical protein